MAPVQQVATQPVDAKRAAARPVHGGLILAGGLFGLSLSVLILGASRGQSTDAGLPGSTAADFALHDTAGVAHRLDQWHDKTLVLVVAKHDAADFARAAAEINQVCGTFASDDGVRIVGVQIPVEAGLLTAEVRTPGVLETQCPALATMPDTDGSVSRSYRVLESPTAFVVDSKGVIRARVLLDREGAAVAVAGTVSSLRTGQPGLAGVRLRD